MTNIPDATEIAQIQKYLWGLAQSGWKPYDGRWTHEDNNAVLGYGWMMVLGKDQRTYHILSSRPSRYDASFAQEQEKALAAITKLVDICPFCAKAARILVAQKLAGGAP